MPRELTVFEAPDLPEDEVWRRLRATLQANPVLTQIYDEGFLAEMVRRRQAARPYLLFRLLLPEDPVSIAFWQSVTGELGLLSPAGAMTLFPPKMRRYDRPEFESWRTELWFPAWLKRSGVGVHLEPAVGSRVGEFSTETEPPTYWEIKSPLDVKEPRKDAEVEMEIQRRLRSIPEPYALELEKQHLDLADVPTAIRQLKQMIAKHHREGGPLPRRFEVPGLVVTACTLSKRNVAFSV